MGWYEFVQAGGVNIGSKRQIVLLILWKRIGNKMAEIKFEIKETISVLSESTKGWKKELNLISWDDKDPKV